MDTVLQALQEASTLDLWQASKAGDLKTVRMALASGQSPIARGGRYDITCLMKAAVMGHEEVVTELLQQEDCDPSLEDSLKRTALHWACAYGRVGMVRQLAVHPRQSSLNSKDWHGNTAIMVAVKNGKAECVLALGKVPGVEPDIKNWYGGLEDVAR